MPVLQHWAEFSGGLPPNHARCMARVWNKGSGGQCQHGPANVLGSSPFCRMHAFGERWQTLGRVDGPVPSSKLTEFQRIAARVTRVKAEAVVSNLITQDLVAEPACPEDEVCDVQDYETEIARFVASGAICAKRRRSRDESQREETDEVDPSVYVSVFEAALRAAHAAGVRALDDSPVRRRRKEDRAAYKAASLAFVELQVLAQANTKAADAPIAGCGSEERLPSGGHVAGK